MQIRRCFARVLFVSVRALTYLAKVLEGPTPQTPHNRWMEDHGDKTLRQQYPLDEASLVLDVGGYEGQWSSDIYARYRCRIQVFEPVSRFQSAIVDRFRSNPDIQVYPFGLAGASRSDVICVQGDRSSLYGAGNANEPVVLVAAAEHFEHERIRLVDLMKVNIEGGEYELLEHLLETGLVQKINNLQIQFHDCVEGSAARMQAIQSRLSTTHRLTWQYLFVWENWQRKDSEP